MLVLNPIDSSEQPAPVMANLGATNGNPLIAELPIPDEVVERYLEVRDVMTKEVITSIEILSRVNKIDKDGRQAYQRKREKVLKSQTHLVAIDLLRSGQSMEMHLQSDVRSDYHILVSRSHQRPYAEVYHCTLRQPLPIFPIPLRQGESEPTIDLNQVLGELYDLLNFDLEIDYKANTDPPIRKEDVEWLDRLLRGKRLR